MTVHRHGKLRQVTIKDCYLYKKMIIVPKAIIKTK